MPSFHHKRPADDWQTMSGITIETKKHETSREQDTKATRLLKEGKKMERGQGFGASRAGTAEEWG